MNIEIANRLVQLRKENGLSQEALAAKLGISRQAISKWERAEASPDTDNLMALAELYGMSLDALLNTANDQYVLDGGETETAEAEKKAKKEKTELQKKAIKMFKFPFPLFVVLIFLAFGFLPLSRRFVRHEQKGALARDARSGSCASRLYVLRHFGKSLEPDLDCVLGHSPLLLVGR